MPQNTNNTWHLITTGILAEQEAQYLLSTFAYHTFFGNWAWDLSSTQSPLKTLSLIETSLDQNTDIPKKAKHMLTTMNLSWAWIRKGRCIDNAQIYDAQSASLFHPQGDRFQEPRLINLLLDIHSWKPLREPKGGHEHIQYEVYKKNLYTLYS